MFGSESAPQPALPEAPPPPPNPPMFGSNATGTNKVKSQSATNQGYAGTILGALGQAANTGQKSLLGS